MFTAKSSISAYSVRIISAALRRVLLLLFISTVSPPGWGGEIAVFAQSNFGVSLPWTPTSVNMFERVAPVDTVPVGQPRFTIVSPEGKLDWGDFHTGAWASASWGVLKTRATVLIDEAQVGSTNSFAGAAVYSSASFRDSLTYSQGGSRNGNLKLSFSVPHQFQGPAATTHGSVSHAESDVPIVRAFAQDYTTGVFLSYESIFMDRDLVDREGISQAFNSVRSTCGGMCFNSDFPDGKITVLIPFVEGLPFSYEVTLTAYAGIYREFYGINMGLAPPLSSPSRLVSALADRSLYFLEATVLDVDGNVLPIDQLVSASGMSYTQSTMVAEPSSTLMLLCGFLMLAVRRYRPNFA